MAEKQNHGSDEEKKIKNQGIILKKRLYYTLVVIMLILLCSTPTSGGNADDVYTDMSEQMIDLIDSAGGRYEEQSEIFTLVQDDVIQAFYGEDENDKSPQSFLTMLETAALNQMAILSQYGVSGIEGTYIDIGDILMNLLSGSGLQDEISWNQGDHEIMTMNDDLLNIESDLIAFYNLLNRPVPFIG